ncbi:MAG: hypothetical protein D6719_02260 [Candidatus Dadabacteria bacterium]|nr:MAG: hypothetical protein D6719_02260 [Candidatus Dadabacteria bacterium]
MIKPKRARICGYQSYIIILVVLTFFLPDLVYAQYGPRFWPYWKDGRAEINTYRYKINYAGKIHGGRALLVYRVEPVAARSGLRSVSPLSAEDRVDTIKLVGLREFRAGLNSFRVLTSVSSPLQIWHLGDKTFRAVTPIRSRLAVTDFSGVLYYQLHRQEGGIRTELHSNVEAEGDRVRVYRPAAPILTEDDFFVRVRELKASWPSGAYRALTSPFFTRFKHVLPEIVDVEVERNVSIKSSAKRIAEGGLITYLIELAGRRYSFNVEAKGVKKILNWRIETSGKKPELLEEAELIASERVNFADSENKDLEKIAEKLGLGK